MNERLFEACGRFEQAELTRDRGAFFGSILATLNHIAVADTIWMHRFSSQGFGFESLAAMADWPRPTSLRDPLAKDLAEWWAYRTKLDGLIGAWMAELQPGHLLSIVRYKNMAGADHAKTLGELLMHFFNHQTHHRGQVTTLLFQSGVDVGVTDLLALLPTSDA